MRATRRLAACAAILLALAGCAMHQPTEVALPPVPEAYREAPAAAGALPERWWHAFGDPLLDELMTGLFAQNLGLAQAFARLEQADAALRVAGAARLPAVTAGAAAGRARQPGLVGGFTGDSRSLSLAAAFELDLWGRLAERSRAAASDREAAREELRTLYLGLSAQLADLYFLAVEQRAQLALSERTVASFADTVERVDRRYRAGLVPALDLYQARQSLAAAQAERHTFEAELAAAEHAVAVLLGRYPDRETAGAQAVLPPPPTFAAGIPSGLVARRPDLRTGLRRVEAADARLAAAIAERFPSVNLLGGFGRSRQETSAGLLRGEFWSLLGDLAMPLVDGGRRRAEADRSRAVLHEALAGYRQAVLAAFAEVEDALAAGRAGEGRVARLGETAAATDAALRLALDRYLHGLGDYLPVLTAQRSHLEAESRLLSARRQLLSARIGLARALGGAWMDEPLQHRLETAAAKDTNR